METTDQRGGKNETLNRMCGRNCYRGGLADGASDSSGGRQTDTTWHNGFPSRLPAVKGIGEIAKGKCAGRHTHPGIETSYILEGEATLKIDGQPDQRLRRCISDFGRCRARWVRDG